MKNCSCGELVDEKYTQCSRCEALKHLGLNKHAVEEDIRSAYRMLSRVWHPDNFELDEKLKAPAAEKLANVNTAFEFLTLTSTERSLEQRPIYLSDSVAAAAPAQNPISDAQAASGGLATPPPTAIPSVPPASVQLPNAASSQEFQQTAHAPGILWQKFKIPLIVLAGIAALAAVLLIRTASSVHGPANEQAATGQISRIRKKPMNPLVGLLARVLNAVDPQPSTEDPESSELAPQTSTFNAQTSTPQAAPQTPAASPQTPNSQHSAMPQSAPRAILPFITVGTTKAEVLAEEGTAASASEDKLVYGASELYFKDDRVTGWRIDPARPIRVKLWPRAYVNPRLARYSIGSTKDEVLAVQGTPTAFTDDKFEYGKSEVTFVNDRVVSWREDPSSTPLWIH
jgi:hypothetical protein